MAASETQSPPGAAAVPPPFDVESLTRDAATARPTEFGFLSFSVDADGYVGEVVDAKLRPAFPEIPRENLFEVWEDRPDVTGAIREALTGVGASAMTAFSDGMWAFHCLPVKQGAEVLAAQCFLVPISRAVRVGLSLGRLTQLVLADTSLQQLIEEAALEVGSVLELELAMVARRQEEGVALRIAAAWPPGAVGKVELPRIDCAESEAMDAARPVRAAAPATIQTPMSDLLDKEITGLACFPLRAQSRIFAVLGAYRADNKPFTDEEMFFIGSICQVVSQAAERWQAMEAQARLTSVIAATTDLIALTKPDGRCFYLNPAMRHLLGYAQDDDISHVRLSDHRPQWAAAFIMERALPAAIAEGTWTGESALLTKDGVEVPISQVLVAHRDKDGKVDQLSAIGRDISEIKRYQALIQAAADQDALTGLANRRAFTAELDKVLRQGTQGALLFLDLDDFKTVNDTLGHGIGDQFLVQLTAALKNNLRNCLLARLGGDEFAIILTDVTVDDARTVAERVLQVARDFEMQVGDSTIRTTASIGIALFNERGAAAAASADTLLAQADLAMYQAKDGGKDMLVCYDGRKAA